MLVEAIAAYHGDQDTIHVAAILQDETGENLQRKLESASVSLMLDGEEVLRKDLTDRDYNEGEDEFLVYFIHPPLTSHLYVTFTATLRDGRTAKTTQAVKTIYATPQDAATNPVIPTRTTKDYTNKQDQEGRNRSPL